jgi:hypothetical protein
VMNVGETIVDVVQDVGDGDGLGGNVRKRFVHFGLVV